jgi:hypothetical protein
MSTISREAYLIVQSIVSSYPRRATRLVRVVDQNLTGDRPTSLDRASVIARSSGEDVAFRCLAGHHATVRRRRMAMTRGPCRRKLHFC